MDAALQYCLTRFTEEQLADGIQDVSQCERSLRRIRSQIAEDLHENHEMRSLEQGPSLETFLSNLNENSTSLTATREKIEHEFRKILSDIQTDIDTIAQVMVAGGNRQNNEEVRAGSNKIRQQIEHIDNELTQLFQVIDFHSSTNCSSRVLIWLRERYRYANELNRFVGKSSSSGDLAALSENGVLMNFVSKYASLCARRRKMLTKFIGKMSDGSSAGRNLMDGLYHTTDATIIANAIRNYIQHRQDEHNQRKERALQQMELEVQQKHAEQHTNATALISALCQLSASSLNELSMKMKIKKVFHHTEQSKRFIPMLIDFDQEQTDKDLQVIMRLDADYDVWTSNHSRVQQTFCWSFCKIMQIPTHSVKVECIKEDSVMLHVLINASCKRLVFQKLSGRGIDNKSSIWYIEAIQQCCQRLDSHLDSIVIGPFTLTIEKCLMDFRWNKCRPSYTELMKSINLLGSLEQNNKASLVPKGWKRFGIKTTDDDTFYNSKWSLWHIAYYGSRGFYAPMILASGLRVSTTQYFARRNNHYVCLSPSIEYIAHPRFTDVWKSFETDSEKCQCYQLVFQCRVNAAALEDPKSETLLQDVHKNIQIDPNFSNNGLEWAIKANTGSEGYIRENIVCCGILVRVVDCSSANSPIADWWQHTEFAEYESAK